MEQVILDTAGELFDRQGFNQTSLQDIAGELGVVRGALYHYFNNRETILVAGVGRLIDRRNDFTEQMRQLAGDPIERLTGIMVGLGAFLNENSVWARISLHDAVALPEEARIRDRISRLQIHDLLVQTLTEGVDLGYLRPHDERGTAVTIVATLIGLQGNFAATTDMSTQEATQLAINVILQGVEDPGRGPVNPAKRGLRLMREGLELIERAVSSR